MKQTAGNVTASGDGLLEGKRYVLMDPDSTFQRCTSDNPHGHVCKGGTLAAAVDPRPNYLT